MATQYCRYWIAIVLILYWITGFAVPAKGVPKDLELRHLDQQIQKTQQEIQHDKGKKGVLSQQLKSNTKKLAKLEKQSAVLKAELYKQQTDLAHLRQQQLLCKQQVCAQQSMLVQQTLADYFLLNQLNEKKYSFDDHERYLVYLKYCNAAQLESLKNLQQKFIGLSSKQNQVISQKKQVQTVLSKQQQSKQQLVKIKQDQQQILTGLLQQIQSKNDKLNQLVANRQTFERLVKKLSQQQHVTQSHHFTKVLFPQGIAFAKLQGKLAWPVTGHITSGYGVTIDKSELKSTGVLIETHANQVVAAVYQGKVIFANWLQGLGLLVIIDHGDGYMSLYGHNRTLYKKVGDVVRAREQIATVNPGVGQNSGGLYFEIRHNGQPVSPQYWCR